MERALLIRDDGLYRLVQRRQIPAVLRNKPFDTVISTTVPYLKIGEDLVSGSSIHNVNLSLFNSGMISIAGNLDTHVLKEVYVDGMHKQLRASPDE